jgi:hypothetical protein
VKQVNKNNFVAKKIEMPVKKPSSRRHRDKPDDLSQSSLFLSSSGSSSYSENFNFFQMLSDAKQDFEL